MEFREILRWPFKINEFNIKKKTINLLKIKTFLMEKYDAFMRLGFIDFNEFIQDLHPCNNHNNNPCPIMPLVGVGQ